MKRKRIAGAQAEIRSTSGRNGKKKKKKKKKEKKRNNPKKIRTEINREFVKQRAIVTTSLTENF